MKCVCTFLELPPCCKQVSKWCIYMRRKQQLCGRSMCVNSRYSCFWCKLFMRASGLRTTPAWSLQRTSCSPLVPSEPSSPAVLARARRNRRSRSSALLTLDAPWNQTFFARDAPDCATMNQRAYVLGDMVTEPCVDMVEAVACRRYAAVHAEQHERFASALTLLICFHSPSEPGDVLPGGMHFNVTSTPAYAWLPFPTRPRLC